jgi:succinate-acetate transporter protein
MVVLVKYLDLLVTIVIEVVVNRALVITKEFKILNMNAPTPEILHRIVQTLKWNIFAVMMLLGFVHKMMMIAIVIPLLDIVRMNVKRQLSLVMT